MAKSKLYETENEILKSLMITTSYTPKVLGGFLISGLVSVFGLYPLVESFFSTEWALNITIVGFIILLIVIDAIKRSNLAKYFNSRIKNVLKETEVRKANLLIARTAILLVLLIDGGGAWLTGVAGQNYYIEHKATHTEEYKNITMGKTNDSVMLEAYKMDLKAYEQREEEYRALCKANLAKGKWRDPVSQNMNTWYRKNPRPLPPKIASSEKMNVEYSSIKENNKSFIDEYLQYIIFIVLVLLTIILQYLTISEIQESYEDKRDDLTPNRIANLKSAISNAKDIKEASEKKMIEQQEELKKVKNAQYREFALLDDKREIVFNEKAVKNANEGIKRIANNTNFSSNQDTKAGFANVYQDPKVIDVEPIYTDKIALLRKLWKNGKVQEGEKLAPKKHVIDINSSREDREIRTLYKELKELKLIRFKKSVGYFAKADYETVISYLRRGEG